MIKKFKANSQPLPGGNWNSHDEPAWHAGDKVIVLAKHCQLSNEQHIVNQLSTGLDVFADLPRVRNYFAHRNRVTGQRALAIAPRYGKGVSGKVSDLMLHVQPGQAVSVIETWAYQIHRTMANLCS